MTFAHPPLLWLLLVPALWLVWSLTRRRRAITDTHPKIIHGEAGATSLTLAPLPAAGTSTLSIRRVRWRLMLGLALATVALARPQWGRIEEPVFEQAREILIAMDLSRSMLAPDVKPTRLERARLLVTSLLEKLQGERVGLVVFSGTAFLQSPLSADYEILREFLPALGPDYLPEGGTNFPALIDTAIAAFGGSSVADRFLIILSDGEADDDTWKSRVDALKTKGIRVIGLGIGTAGGAMIPDAAGAFVKDERGAVVLSKLDSSTLRALADATNGTYADASEWLDLTQLLQATVERGQRGEFREASRVRLAERFQWALAPALLLLAWSFWREFPVRPKPRTLARHTIRATASAAKDNFRAATTPAVALLLLGIFPRSASAVERTDIPPLTGIVSRLAAADQRSATDWAQLARETITWGQDIKSAQKPVPEGPVRDALTATDLGKKLNRQAADWPTLRADLEKLLEKPDEQKQPQPDQQKSSQNQSNQNQDQKSQQDKNQSQDQSQQQQQPSQSSDGSSPQQQPPQSADQKKPDNASEQNPSSGQDSNQSGQPSSPPPPGSGQQAFGDMKPGENSPQPPPSPSDPGDMQQVGGAGTQTVSASATIDPALVQPLQKLDQVRTQDSPVRLYQLMQQQENSTTAPAPRKGRNW